MPATVAQTSRKTVPIEITAIGNVEAHGTVSVKSKIGGELLKVHFREGQEASKGDLLFTINPRPYEAALAEAKARLARDMALLKKAQEDAKRHASLIQKQVVSQEQYDQIKANLAPWRPRSRPTRPLWKALNSSSDTVTSTLPYPIEPALCWLIQETGSKPATTTSPW